MPAFRKSLPVSDKLFRRAHTIYLKIEVVGPVGLEPTTKGFTLPGYFYPERTISSPAIELITRARDALACY